MADHEEPEYEAERPRAQPEPQQPGPAPAGFDGPAVPHCRAAARAGPLGVARVQALQRSAGNAAVAALLRQAAAEPTAGDRPAAPGARPPPVP